MPQLYYSNCQLHFKHELYIHPWLRMRAHSNIVRACGHVIVVTPAVIHSQTMHVEFSSKALQLVVLVVVAGMHCLAVGSGGRSVGG